MGHGTEHIATVQNQDAALEQEILRAENAEIQGYSK